MTESETWSLCQLTFVLTLILGAAVYFTHGVPSSAQALDAPSERRPAAVGALLGGKNSIRRQGFESSIPVIDLKCLGAREPIRLQTNEQQIRLVGKHCDKSDIKRELLIENSSNGFEASIFDRGRNKFSSDYLTLNKGTNALKVSYIEDGKKTVVSELIVQRSYKE